MMDDVVKDVSLWGVKFENNLFSVAGLLAVTQRDIVKRWKGCDYVWR